MTRSTVVLTAFLCQWFCLVSSFDQISAAFKVDLYHKGQIPIAGAKQLAEVKTDSVFECARNCWNSGNHSGCRGFSFDFDSCTDNNSSPTQSGMCQTLEFKDAKSLSFGPANSSCEEFYVADKPSKKKTFAQTWRIYRKIYFAMSVMFNSDWLRGTLNF
jgi:hypothetical protein